MVGDVLKSVRELSGWSQADMVREFGGTSGWYSGLEMGRHQVTLRALRAYASAGCMTISELAYLIELDGGLAWGPDRLRQDCEKRVRVLWQGSWLDEWLGSGDINVYSYMPTGTKPIAPVVRGNGVDVSRVFFDRLRLWVTGGDKGREG